MFHSRSWEGRFHPALGAWWGMALGIDPTVDYVFKRLYGDPQHVGLSVHLLSAIFEDQFEVGGVEILTPFLEKEFEDDKLAVLDVRVRDLAGRNYNLEMQTTLPAGLRNRLVYYVSGMYSDQLAQGDCYTALSPAIGVCFVIQALFANTEPFHTRFRLYSPESQLVLTDQFEVHLLELPKYRGTLVDLPRARPKERWTYFLGHGAELTLEDIRRYFPEPEFLEAGGILDMISKSSTERLRYELRIKAQRDYLSNMEAARQEGRQEGHEDGRQEGREQGRQEGRLEGREEGRQEGREEGRHEGREQGYRIGRIQTLQELLGDVVVTSEELRTWDLDRLSRLTESLQDRLRDRT